MPSRSIQIYGLNYWPESTGNAPYTTGLAEYLAATGDDVTVYAGFPYYPQWQVSPGYRRLRTSEHRRGVTVRRFRQYVPTTQSALRRLGMEASFLVNIGLSPKTPKPDVVVGIIPALADGLLALSASRRYQAPLVLIIQDLMGSAAEQSGVAGGTKVAAATSKLEMWICRHATQIGVVATGFRDRLIQSGVSAEKVHVTRNWSHIGEPIMSRADIRTRLGLPLDRFIALHAGNMGLKQGLDHVIDAARIARGTSPDMLFVLMGDGNQRERLQQMAVDLDNVRFLPPQDEELFPSILAASDVLLVSQRPTVIDMSLPSKLTSYFSVGRPVVAAVSPQSETAKVIAESGGGLLVDPSDSVALVSALESLSRTPFHAQQIGERGMAYATSHLSADAALANLERLIHSAHHRAVADTKELATT